MQLYARAFEVIVANWITFTERHHCIKLNAKNIYKFMRSIPKPLGFSDKSEDELKVHVLKMNIKEEDGWIYFNELLYRILRNSYGRFTLTKSMQIGELVTQYKLFNLTTSHIKISSRKHLEDRFMRKVGAGGLDTVNPFLTEMYYRISFLAWISTLRKFKKNVEIDRIRAQRRKRNVDLGLDSYVTDTETDLTAEPEFEEVEIEVEHLSEWTLSSDEENGIENSRRKEDDKKTERSAKMLAMSVAKDKKFSPRSHR